jgi:hypothetical protein
MPIKEAAAKEETLQSSHDPNVGVTKIMEAEPKKKALETSLQDALMQKLNLKIEE